jgi:pimeloyl-ACP methyl ester carboxylesterase
MGEPATSEGYVEVPGGRVWYLITGADRDVTARLAEIQVPALVTGGRHDEARPAHLAVLAEGLRHAELVIFENSSHMAFIEEREAYIRVVEAFLGRVEAGSRR